MQKGLNGFQLKIIGVITMVIDHLGQFFTFLGAPLWFHWIGRIAAPIFLFESSEGFVHTRSRKKYMFRLLVGFWIMGGIDWILKTYFSVDNELVINNIFGTIFLGTVFMQAVEHLRNGVSEKSSRTFLKGILWFVVPLLLSALPLFFLAQGELSTVSMGIFRTFTFLIPTLLLTEGGFLFVLLAVLFYLFHGKKALQAASLVVIALIVLFAGGLQHPFTENFQWMMLLSAVPIILYNGEKGRSMRNFFYYFYPAHIALFAIVSFLLQK
ncbi:membrane protein [Enterococcus florum]|uniref:Membrane protein n=1 Tax=Enterococcus florum TaxID=2480627 RepID=A0A4P5P4F0_9ENTE|nr:TraX family protein [Enterococcus florum]GCF92677.1 membrane protein [Enterococcus florum]